MPRKLWESIVLTVVSLCAVPTAACAQYLNPFDTCGAGPRLMPRAAMHPCPNPCGQTVCQCDTMVRQTQLVPRQQISYRDEIQTQYRTEQVLQQVPVNRVRNVTVDAGGYQTVWVPRLVTQQVSETVYEPRIGMRTVPVQTVRRVPQVTTVLEPRTSVGVVRHQLSTGPIYTHGAVSQPVQLQAPILLHPQPYGTPAPVQPYQPPSTSQLAPHPHHLDIPAQSTSRAYDADVTTRSSRRDGYVNSQSASAVFRQFR